MPAFSSCLISWSMNSWYFSGTIYGLDAISGPSLGMFSLIKLVLSIFITFCEMICKYFLFRRCWSLVLDSLGMSTSGMELAKPLGSGFSCKLVFYGNWGSSLEVSHQSLLQLTSWTSLHFSTGCIDAIAMFVPILIRTLLAFRMGMFSCCGVSPVQDIQQNYAFWKLECISTYLIEVSSVRNFRGFNFNDRHWNR